MKMPAGALSLVFAFLVSTAVAQTPVQKVVTLLQNLQTQVQKEAQEEAATYDKFSCFCRDTTAARSKAILDNRDNIAALSASIEEHSAKKASTASELGERQARHEKLSKDLDETKVRCMKEFAILEAALADATKAVSSVQKALTVLSKANSSPALLTVEQKAAVADALRLAAAAGQAQGTAFLQGGVDPNDPEYKFHSKSILQTLQKLLDDFTARKKETDGELAKTKTACDSTKQSLTDELTQSDGYMSKLKEQIDSLAEKVASDRQMLVQTEGLLEDNQIYLKALTEKCEARAKDWDQRSTTRASELRAISEALAILTQGSSGRSSVEKMDSAVNQRALLLSSKSRVLKAKMLATAQPKAASAKSPSFLQVAAAARSRSLRGRSPAATRQEKAMALLSQEAARLKSSALSSVAAKIAEDPFAKVKTLIQDLIERLLGESTQEATKQSFCDTEVGKATQARDFRFADVNRLLAELGSLQAKKESLTIEISQLQESIAKLRDTLNTTSVLREQEKAENVETLKTAREGVAAVTEAIAVLKAFYSQAAKAALNQVAQGPVTDAPNPGFEGSYTGRQDGAKGVIALLEVVKEDFERTVRTTEESEKKAAEDFVSFDRTSRVDIGSQETAVELNTQELASTNDAIVQRSEDLAKSQALLDDALKTLQDLKPMCIDFGMSFSERAAKRDEEIAALKKALCVLDPNKVEAECGAVKGPLQ